MSEEFEDISAVNKRKDEARKDYEGMDLHGLVSCMQIVRAEKDRLEGTLRTENARYDLLRIELIPAAMEDEGVERVTYEGIGRVNLTGDMYVKVQNKAGLMDWLSDEGLGDIVQPSINASTLKALIKRRIANGSPIPEDFVKVTPFTRASITKG